MSSATYPPGPQIAPVPNHLLLAARAGRKSPTGSGRVMSRQEVVDELNRYLSRPIDAKHYGRIERGEIRWPGRDLRDALRRMFCAQTDAELGLFVIRRQPSVASDHDVRGVWADPAAAPTVGRRLLWKLAAQRDWQTPEMFRAHFERAVRDLAERDGDPALLELSVSDRQVRRWLEGDAQPRPKACRVLEFMFGRPIGRLFGPVEPESEGPATHTLNGYAASEAPGSRSEAAVGSTNDGSPPVVPIKVSVSPGAAVTIFCDDGETACVAVLAGTVHILIDTTAAVSSHTPRLMTTVANGSGAGGAQVLSIAHRTARRSADGRRKGT